MAEVVIENGGFIVLHPDYRGHAQYVGRDGYWSRIRQAVAPWKIISEAQAMADDINKNEKPSFR